MISNSILLCQLKAQEDRPLPGWQLLKAAHKTPQSGLVIDALNDEAIFSVVISFGVGLDSL